MRCAAIIQVTSEGEQPPVDWRLVEAALAEANGIPAVIGSRAARARVADTRGDGPSKTPASSS